jgi:hypothetical protein
MFTMTIQMASGLACSGASLDPSLGKLELLAGTMEAGCNCPT